MKMKHMKKAMLVLSGVIGAVGLASASDDFSYTATAASGSSPDGVDQNSSPVNVWTEVLSAGGLDGTGDGGLQGSGVYFGNPDGSGGIGGSAVNSWQAYSYDNPGNGNNGTALGGSVNSYDTFAGGALAIGQTVSINFVMRATDPAANGFPAGQVGVSLLNGSGGPTGSGDAITFYIYGGGPGNYFYRDAGSTAASAGSMSYQYQNAFNIAFTVTGAGTYSAVAGSDNWNGTFSGSLSGIDVFNDAGGNGSDVGFNNLTVAPEPSILAVVSVGGVLLFSYPRRRLAGLGFLPA
jgi:hypothetical protein